MTELDFLARHEQYVFGISALCVLLGTIISCFKIQHQGEISFSAGKWGILVLKSVHTGTVLIVFGVLVALYQIRNPSHYETIRRANGDFETRVQASRAIERATAALKAAPKAKK